MLLDEVISAQFWISHLPSFKLKKQNHLEEGHKQLNVFYLFMTDKITLFTTKIKNRVVGNLKGCHQ